MTLIKSISGVRGTIGGQPDQGLTPLDIVKFCTAYAQLLKKRSGKSQPTVVIGRDARLSGEMVASIASGTLIGCGCHIVDLGLSTTPTVEVAVPMENADGGIIFTASHNPKQWNALKLLNENGEFISAAEGEELLEMINQGDFNYVEVDDLGQKRVDEDYISKHIDAVLALDLVDVEAIKTRNFKVAIDAVNSTGGIALPALLERLGVTQVLPLYCEPTGHFPHNPEPLPEHLTEISSVIQKEGADIGFVVDPDVDRLAMVCEDGSMFGEEYTLVAIADYVLGKTPGDVVSNMSSTRALRDVAEKHGQKHSASAVGEVNVVVEMKRINAVVGGEGNGGIIYPASHYGRDALVGIALFLSHLANTDMKASELRKSYPSYFISKNKIALDENTDVDGILQKMKEKYSNEDINDRDGVKIDFADTWVHMRKSNTEPIIRIYAEARTEKEANELGSRFVSEIADLK